MTTPAEIRHELQRTLLALAQDGKVPLIMDIHSIVCEGNTVSVGFDVVPGDSPIFFEFEKPAEVGNTELTDFARWLAYSGQGETLH